MTAHLPFREIEANAVRLCELVRELAPGAPPARRWPDPLSLIEPIAHSARQDASRQVLQPPRGLVAYPTLEALADRVAELLAGRGYDLVKGVAAFSHTDTFPKISVYAAGETKADAEWLCAAVLLGEDRDHDLDRLEWALAHAMRRRG